MLRREDVMEVMFWKRQGLSRRKIAAKMGIHRNTVSKFFSSGGERSPYDTSKRQSQVEEHRERILAWMEDDDYTATWMFDRLKVLGYRGSLRILQRFVQKERGRLVRKAFVPFETEPGRQAQVDFAELGVVDEGGVKVGRLYLFLMVLGFSRKRYAELMLRPDLPSFLDAHQRAFEFFGGTPAEILYDNMKNVVTRVREDEPQWNKTFLSFALHCSFTPRLCPPYASWVKGKVERPIRFIREGFWRGYTYRGIHAGNRDLIEWLLGKEHLVHGTTRQSITERFETERHSLGPLAAHGFDTSARHYRSVGKDCCVHFGCNRYMLPHRAVGKKVMLRVKDDLLRAFDGPDLLVAYRIPEGKGHLVADPHLLKALRGDREQARMKYRTPPAGRKGSARTIGLVSDSLCVPVRDIACYDAIAGGGHE